MITTDELHPPLGLIVRTPRLVLQAADESCAKLLSLAVLEHGIHDQGFSPFVTHWSDADIVTVSQRVFTDALPKSCDGLWKLTFAVRTVDRPDIPIGMVTLRQDEEDAEAVRTSSWFIRPMHGKGLGTETRAALLKLAFQGLNAEKAVSSAFAFNSPSLGVTKKFGYTLVGSEFREVRGRLEERLNLALTRDQWREHPAAQALSADVSWEGLAPVTKFFGIA